MSLQDIPEIPGVDPAAVKALTRLCAGDEPMVGGGERPEITKFPRLVDLGDDIYVIFTDGGTAVLLQMEGDELPDLESNEQIQQSFGRLTSQYGSDYTLYFEGIDVRGILDWCGEGTEKCPRCGGNKSCMFPRSGTTASKRENPDITDCHMGWLGDVLLDRRRLQIPLQMLGVDEGEVDVVTVDNPGGDDIAGSTEKTSPFQGVALIGENWRIYSAGLNRDPDRKDAEEKAPRFPL